MKPVHIFFGGEELLGWTKMTLTRKKKDLTGSLSVTMFFSYVPKAPVAVNATRGKEILVYIGGHLAFTGTLDKRKGKGRKKSGKEVKAEQDDNDASAGGSASISSEEYTVTLTARGKTKKLIDSSHQHKTTNILNPTTKAATEELIQPWGVQLDWMGKEVQLDKVRLRDGANVFDELKRLGAENAHYMYETRDGKLRVTDDTGPDYGENLILGQNILDFEAEQSEDEAKSKVKVKGQRTKKGQRGEAAVLKVEKELTDNWVGSNVPFIIQHYGDSTPEALERRGRHELNKRSSESKKLDITVFHVQTSTGEPWDIGTTHYVEVPPEGIFDEFECTELQYTVEADKKIQTKLTLSPPPKKNGGSAISAASQSRANIGDARRANAGITIEQGTYPASWTGPDIAATVLMDTPTTAQPSHLAAASAQTPPLKLESAQ